MKQITINFYSLIVAASITFALFLITFILMLRFKAKAKTPNQLQQTQLTSSQNQLERSESELKVVNAALQGQLSESKSELVKSSSELASTKNANAALKGQLDAVKEQIKSAQSELSDTKEQIKSAQTELFGIKEQLQRSESALTTSQAELEGSKAASAAFISQFTERKKQLERSESELKVVNAALQGQLSESKSELVKSSAELASTKNANDALQVQLAAVKEQIKSAQTELSDTKEQIKSAQTELSVIKEQLQRSESALTTSQAELEGSKAASAAFISQFTERKKQLERSESELKVVNAALQRQLSESKSELVKSSSELASTKNANDALKGQLDAVKEQIKSAQSELSGIKEQLQSELSGIKEQLQSAQSELSDTKEQLQSAQTELSDTKEQLQSAQSGLAEAKNTDLRAQLTTSQAELEGAQAAPDTVKKENIDFKVKLPAADEEEKNAVISQGGQGEEKKAIDCTPTIEKMLRHAYLDEHKSESGLQDFLDSNKSSILELVGIGRALFNSTAADINNINTMDKDGKYKQVLGLIWYIYSNVKLDDVHARGMIKMFVSEEQNKILDFITTEIFYVRRSSHFKSAKDKQDFGFDKDKGSLLSWPFHHIKNTALLIKIKDNVWGLKLEEESANFTLDMEKLKEVALHGWSYLISVFCPTPVDQCNLPLRREKDKRNEKYKEVDPDAFKDDVYGKCITTGNEVVLNFSNDSWRDLIRDHGTPRTDILEQSNRQFLESIKQFASKLDGAGEIIEKINILLQSDLSRETEEIKNSELFIEVRKIIQRKQDEEQQNPLAGPSLR